MTWTRSRTEDLYLVKPFSKLILIKYVLNVFLTGKISNELREALGLKNNQLPPFIYVMRKYGYPIGWLLEAKVKQTTNLAVHDGIDSSKPRINQENAEKSEEGAVNSDEGNSFYVF